MFTIILMYRYNYQNVLLILLNKYHYYFMYINIQFLNNEANEQSPFITVQSCTQNYQTNISNHYM